MKIIVTGATGSLGAFLTRWLAAKGHQVFALGRIAHPPEALLACSTYLQADITQPLKLPNADVCIHCAGLADDRATPAALYAANVVGTRSVVNASRHCKTAIYISSSSVYQSSDDPLTEDMAGEMPGEPLSAYGKSKLMAERVATECSQHESCFILRPRGIYGAGDKVLLPRLLKFLKNGKIVCIGDMNVALSLTHYSNLAMAVDACMDYPFSGTRIYNVSDDVVYVLRDVVRKMLLSLHTDYLFEIKLPLFVFQFLSKLSVGDYTPLLMNTVSKNHVLDISKIKDELNYAPGMNLDLCLNEIRRWVDSIGGTEVLKKANPELAWMA